jgi:hypothetical protein
LVDKEYGYDISCDHIQEDNIQHHGQPAEKKENNCCFIQKIQRPPSPLTKEEINMLLHSHVTALAYTDLQCIHSPGYEIQTSSIYENVNMILNNDSHVFDETLQEVNEPIYDDDFQPRNHLVSPVLFHEEDRAVTFNSLEGSSLFKDVLDCDMEEYKSEIESMPEKGSEFLMVDVPSICLIDDPLELSAEPKYDEYSDDEEDFKDLLSNEISSNPTYQLKDD